MVDLIAKQTLWDWSRRLFFTSCTHIYDQLLRLAFESFYLVSWLLNCEIPQGSIPSSLLFNIFMQQLIEFIGVWGKVTAVC